jgi:hypothetical protein
VCSYCSVPIACVAVATLYQPPQTLNPNTPRSSSETSRGVEVFILHESRYVAVREGLRTMHRSWALPSLASRASISSSLVYFTPSTCAQHLLSLFSSTSPHSAPLAFSPQAHDQQDMTIAASMAMHTSS